MLERGTKRINRTLERFARVERELEKGIQENVRDIERLEDNIARLQAVIATMRARQEALVADNRRADNTRLKIRTFTGE